MQKCMGPFWVKKRQGVERMKREPGPGETGRMDPLEQYGPPMRSRGRIIAMETAGILLGVLAILSLVAPLVLKDETGRCPYEWYFVAAYVLLSLLAVVVLLRVLPDSRRLAYANILKKLEDVPLSVLPGAGREEFQTLLYQSGFKEIAPGIFCEEWRPYFNDKIWHCFIFFESETFEEACDALLGRIKAFQFHGHGPGSVFCRIPVFCRQTVTEQDRAAFKQAAARIYARERSEIARDFIMPVLAERASGQGWYLAQEPLFYLYGNSCRLLKRLKRHLQ